MAFTVRDLWLYPVQSLRGQKMDALDYVPDGLRLDRWFGIRDVETGGVGGASMAQRAPPPPITCGAAPGSSAHSAPPQGENRLSHRPAGVSGDAAGARPRSRP